MRRQAAAAAAGTDVPWCRRERTTNLSIASGTNDTLLAWETTDNNNPATFSTPNVNTIRVLLAGVYCIHVQLQWDASKVEGSVVSLNSALGFTWNKGFYDEQNAGHTIEHNQTVTFIRRIPANTSLRVYVVQFAGVARTVETAWFEVMQLGTYTGTNPND